MMVLMVVLTAAHVLLVEIGTGCAVLVRFDKASPLRPPSRHGGLLQLDTLAFLLDHLIVCDYFRGGASG